MKNNLKYYLHRSVGFMNYDERLTKDLIMDGFKKIDENQESLNYLKSSYHTCLSPIRASPLSFNKILLYFIY